MWPAIAAWALSPKNWLLMGVGLAVAGALAWAGIQTTRLHHAEKQAAAAKVVAQISADHAIVASGQVAAMQSAAEIADAGAQRQAVDITVHQDNAHAIQAAPGSAVRLDPALNAAGRRGLCRYPAYADDPGCAGLRPDHPAALPPTGQPDAASPD